MNRNLITIGIAVAAAVGLALVSGCESDAQTGSAVGALTGAAIGQMAGGDTESTLIGTAIGGIAGYMIGNEGDKAKAREERYCMRQEMNTVLVKVTNRNGSIIRVPLRRHGFGFLGTRGEYYSTLPTEDQLRPVYGF
ncbi:MAG: glycine zipper domain-containing protein [Planctomycetota bacterium]|jgi:hypothetical protein